MKEHFLRFMVLTAFTWMVTMAGVSAQQATSNATPVKVAEEKPTMSQVKQGNQALNGQKPPRANSSASTPAKPQISPLGTVVSQPAEQKAKSQEAIVVLTKEQAAQARKMEEEKAAKQRAEKEANAKMMVAQAEQQPKSQEAIVVLTKEQAAQARKMEEEKTAKQRAEKEANAKMMVAQAEQAAMKKDTNQGDPQGNLDSKKHSEPVEIGSNIVDASIPKPIELVSKIDFDNMSAEEQQNILSRPTEYKIIDKTITNE